MKWMLGIREVDVRWMQGDFGGVHVELPLYHTKSPHVAILTLNGHSHLACFSPHENNIFCLA